MPLRGLPATADSRLLAQAMFYFPFIHLVSCSKFSVSASRDGKPSKVSIWLFRPRLHCACTAMRPASGDFNCHYWYGYANIQVKYRSMHVWLLLFMLVSKTKPQLVCSYDYLTYDWWPCALLGTYPMHVHPSARSYKTAGSYKAAGVFAYARNFSLAFLLCCFLCEWSTGLLRP